MRSIAFFVIGIGIGVLLSYPSSRNAPAPVAEAPAPAPEAPQIVAQAVISETQTMTQAKPVPAPAPPADEVAPLPEDELPPPAPDAPSSLETAHGIVISEESVAEMERHREELQNYAYATQTDDGWRLQILPEDKVFLKAGLNSGDVITFDSMDAQLEMPERSRLADRMIAILNTIRR